MNEREGRSITGSAAAIAIGIAGLVHILIAPAHWQHAQAHGIFFLGAGIIEVAWAIAYIRKPSRRLTYFGIGVASMLLALWLITRALPAPFGHGHEVVDGWAVVCKLSELVGILALGILAYQTVEAGTGMRASVRALVLAVAIGLGAGLLTYAVARAAEPLLPGLAGVEEHESHEHPEDAGGAVPHEHEGAEEAHPHEAGEGEATAVP
jgi:hypothetical protein